MTQKSETPVQSDNLMSWEQHKTPKEEIKCSRKIPVAAEIIQAPGPNDKAVKAAL